MQVFQNIVLFVSEVTFDLNFLPWDSDGCNASTDSFHEGVEVSFRSLVENSMGEWIPVMYLVSPYMGDSSETQSPISLTKNAPNGTSGSFLLRGYKVPYATANDGRHSVSLCRDSHVLQNPLQFRWLQTSSQSIDGYKHVVLLDNITIGIHNGSLSASMFEEHFDVHTSPQYVFQDCSG